MEDFVYEELARIEDKHWWFVGRRAVVNSVLEQMCLSNEAQILEIGCGSGGNLKMLSTYGNLTACEMYEPARNKSNERKICSVLPGSLPNEIPFGNESFDLITLFDVLEHIDEDVESLKRIYGLLKRGGKLLLTVPCHPFLQGRHDVVHHHLRRYTQKDLLYKIKLAGFMVNRVSYLNTLLFPIIIMLRLYEKFFIRNTGKPLGHDIPHPLINKILSCIFSSEGIIIKYFPLPLGASSIVVAQKH